MKNVSSQIYYNQNIRKSITRKSFYDYIHEYIWTSTMAQEIGEIHIRLTKSLVKY